MSDDLNYPYLLAVHTLCLDGQLHQNELLFLQSLGQNIGVDPATEEAAELILSQADEHMGLEVILQRIAPDQRPRALSLAVLAAHFDGPLNCYEQKTLEKIQRLWKVCDEKFLHMHDLARMEVERLMVDLESTTQDAISTKAKALSSLESVLGKMVVDRVVCESSTEPTKELISTYEQRLLEQLRQHWDISDTVFAEMQDLANKEAQHLMADLESTGRGDISAEAKTLKNLKPVLENIVIDCVMSTIGMESIKERIQDYRIASLCDLESSLGKKILDSVVNALDIDSMKERIQDYRIDALLAGPKYEKVIEKCRDVGLRDIEVADNCLQSTAKALQEIGEELDSKIAEINTQISDKPAQAAREALRSMKDDRAEFERLINHELQEVQELQIKKRRAMNFYTIAFMGRSKAGKSTLHAVMTGGGWNRIGVGRQNTTRLNRVYEWHNIRIIDTPGIATPGGEELEKIAERVIDEADLICFVVTNNNQQTSEFEFLKQLRNKGKPLLILLNVKEDLSHPVRRMRFLENPDQAFSDDKDRLGGHIDRIRSGAAEHYGTSNFPIIPVQLLAAQIAQQQPDHEHADTLMKASRLRHFLDSVRFSLLDEGLLRRSQNLLGSTVADIERPFRDVRGRSDFYLDFSKQIRDRAGESAQRLKKAQRDHARQLEQDLRGVFAALQRAVPDFAEDHWDDSESYLNDAWFDEIRRFGMEKRINLAQEKAVEAFSEDMKDLLTEVNQEINLQRKFSFSSEKLDEQDSSVWLQKTLQWGSGLSSLGIGVLALANIWNPGGWFMAGAALIGVIASFFESKASKRRKAVAKISSALESQIERQEKQIVEAALKHFSEQCLAGAAAVQDYFRLSADGLSFVGQTLGRGAETLQKQTSILNIHFAARILDFAGHFPSESSAEMLRAQIHKVRRKVGQSIDIEVFPKMWRPKNLNIVESIIQEKITLQKTGAQS